MILLNRSLFVSMSLIPRVESRQKGYTLGSLISAVPGIYTINSGSKDFRLGLNMPPAFLIPQKAKNLI